MTAPLRLPRAASLRELALYLEALCPRQQTVAHVARANDAIAREVEAEDRRKDCGHSEYDVHCTCEEDES